MAHSEMNGFLRQLRRAALRHGGGVTDGQLLECFLRAREQAAFEELVRRHGPMVLGVCRRVLLDRHDAEDAFQATFLILVRKASSIVARETVGNWLYGVAFRTAQKARAAAARRRVKEKQMAKPEAIAEDVWRELRPVLDQELNGLPDKYREPVVLCDIEGHTRKAAALRLGCPEGTLSVRLSRARVLLAKRLARRGLALSGGAVAVALSHNAASACVPAPLLSSTVQAATLVAAGHAAAGVVSAPVAILTEGVLQTMLRTKLKLAVAMALAVGLIGVGIGVYQASAAPPGTPPGATTLPANAAAAAPAPDAKPADDAKDDEKINLPKGQAPTQVLASLDKDGKLVIKTAVMNFRAVPLPAPAPGGFQPLPPGALPPPAAGPGGVGPVPPAAAGPAPAPPAALPPAATGPGGFGPVPPAAPAAPPAGFPGGGGPGPGAVGVPARVNPVFVLQTQTYDLDDVQVLDTKGKQVDKKELAKLLKEEKVAMASLYGQPVDPLHLRVLKDDILTFVLPMPKPRFGAPGQPGLAPPGFAPPNAPGGVPGLPAGGGGTTGAPPRFGPADPAIPVPPPANLKPPRTGGTSDEGA